ncbi:MAG: hypothetical protein A3E38_02625 [Candidatus Moranbacteria bacterium RIFCSPHIGHO2_12_FULL_54_9]|nr:MAG: hypothetical protein A3E38_02625 [Candidatus Moranbacteria bacterium RIFCSPHIGHO2_12_FULL_54_9]
MSYRLGKNILATVTYYDVLNMPLSAFEIWKHLITQEFEHPVGDTPCTLGDVARFLASGQLTQRINEQNGFYFLPGREALVAERIRAEKISAAKLKRMRRLARVLACVPYLGMLGATGSLAMKNGTRGSDWDMFVVLRSGKIWIGRTLLTGFLQCIGKRRHGKKVRDRACLNYFVTDDNLEIGIKDLFSAHEYRFFIPLVNFELFQIFELKNRWIREYHPNFALTMLPSLWTVESKRFARHIQQIGERIFDMFTVESWLASWQKEKIRRNPKTHMSGSMIEANDHALIFLPSPRGPRVFEQFKERLSA